MTGTSIAEPSGMQGHRSDRSGPLADVMRAFERRLIFRALKRHKGRTGDAAEALGLTRRGLEKRLDALGLWDDLKVIRDARER